MRIGILETGRPPERLAAEYGDYGDMVERLLGAPGFAFRRYWLQGGEAPAAPDDCDAWAITGSRCSAIDEAPWMLGLEGFLVRARAARRKTIGICFGHQILAKALGGRVERAAGGWRLGLNAYRLIHAPDWLARAPDEVVLPAIHQDQVVAAPEEAESFATGVDCPIAALRYGDWAASFQAHPEFSLPFLEALLAVQVGVLPDAVVAPAKAALSAPGARTDGSHIREGLVTFLNDGARAARGDAAALSDHSLV